MIRRKQRISSYELSFSILHKATGGEKVNLLRDNLYLLTCSYFSCRSTCSLSILFRSCTFFSSILFLLEPPNSIVPEGFHLYTFFYNFVLFSTYVPTDGVLYCLQGLSDILLADLLFPSHYIYTCTYTSY